MRTTVRRTHVGYGQDEFHPTTVSITLENIEELQLFLTYNGPLLRESPYEIGRLRRIYNRELRAESEQLARSIAARVDFRTDFNSPPWSGAVGLNRLNRLRPPQSTPITSETENEW